MTDRGIGMTGRGDGGGGERLGLSGGFWIPAFAGMTGRRIGRIGRWAWFDRACPEHFGKLSTGLVEGLATNGGGSFRVDGVGSAGQELVRDLRLPAEGLAHQSLAGHPVQSLHPHGVPAQAAEKVEHAAQVRRGLLDAPKQRGRLAHLGHVRVGHLLDELHSRRRPFRRPRGRSR